jgi:hypothetical protein
MKHRKLRKIFALNLFHSFSIFVLSRLVLRRTGIKNFTKYGVWYRVWYLLRQQFERITGEALQNRLTYNLQSET